MRPAEETLLSGLAIVLVVASASAQGPGTSGARHRRSILRCPLHHRQALQSNVLDALQLLIRTPSVNPDLDPEAGCNEAAVASVARDWFTARGVRSWTDEAAPRRLNCVAEAGDRQGRTLVFCAHLDTVGTSGMAIQPFEPTLE